MSDVSFHHSSDSSDVTSVKEPWLAVVFSSVFPGFGQIYAGATLIGCVIVAIAVFVLGAIAWIMLSDSGSVRIAVQLCLGYLIFSLWNLFNAHRQARKVNDYEFEQRRKETKDPWLAAFLSKLIPGLGHAYQEMWLFAILFFILVVGAQTLAEVVPLLAIFSLLLSLFCFFHAYISSPTERETSRELIVQVCWLLLAANVLSLLLAISIRTFVAEARFIPSEAMSPTLQINDRLFVNKLDYRFESPDRGEVIIFQAPQAALTAASSTADTAYIKRVIGLPGETIEVKEGSVYVDGERLAESYVRSPIAYTWGPETVPADAYFVLGDNRNSSLDSHVWGFLPAENIIGKATKIFWPPQRQGNIER